MINEILAQIIFDYRNKKEGNFLNNLENCNFIKVGKFVRCNFYIHMYRAVIYNKSTIVQ